MARTTKDQRGKLSKLPELPLDVLFEIFGFLWPVDLLHLIRTTTVFRTLLRQRSNRWIWKLAFENYQHYPLPELRSPDPEVEPEHVQKARPSLFPDENYVYWANLLFVDDCHECLKKGTMYANAAQAGNWTTIMARYCYKCFYGRFIEDCSWKWPSWHILHQRGLHSWDFESYTFVSNYKTVKNYVLRDEHEEAVAAVNASGDDNEALQQYLDEKRRAWVIRRNLADICWGWHEHIVEVQDVEYAKACSRRADEIFAKLRELGWGDELDLMDEQALEVLKESKGLKQARPLSNDIWKRLQPKVVAHMEEIKAKRLDSPPYRALRLRPVIAMVEQCLDAYKRTRPMGEHIPGLIDVCSMEPIRSIIITAPADATTTEADLGPAMRMLPQLTVRWRQRADLFLLLLLHSRGISGHLASKALHSLIVQNRVNLFSQLMDFPGARFELASSLFLCTDECCRDSRPRPLWYPEVLDHISFGAVLNNTENDSHDEALRIALTRGAHGPVLHGTTLPAVPLERGLVDNLTVFRSNPDQMTTTAIFREHFAKHARDNPIGAALLQKFGMIQGEFERQVNKFWTPDARMEIEQLLQDHLSDLEKTTHVQMQTIYEDAEAIWSCA